MSVNCWFTDDAPISMNFFEVGNPMYIGMAEEIMENQVMEAVDFLETTYGNTITLDIFQDTLYTYDIDLTELPSWLLSAFNRFKIV